ncbi:MAG: hypothetical protein IKI82_06380 [Lachnospiraceae bacterium]|nr:hypothetical protein [Lachnospiraceae bacterium]
MKKGLARILAILMLLTLTACSGGSTPTRAPQEAKTTAAATQTPSSSAAPTTEPETEPAHIPPHTALLPPPQNLKDFTHLSGAEEYWTDPETGVEYVVFEDLGEDGHTRTMNCFDESGNLLWWETWEYDENEQEIRKLRWNPEMTRLISREELTRENGVLIGMQHYDCVYGETGGMEQFMTEEASYYPNGNLYFRVTYYPFLQFGEYYIEHQYEYAEDGTEVHHLVFEPYGGGILEEYVYGEKVIRVPDTVREIYKLLNETPAEEFDAMWEACQAHMEKKKLTEQWEKLCYTFSGMMDMFHGSSGEALLYRLREEYGLKLFQNKASYGLYRNYPPSYYDVWDSVNKNAVSPSLFAKIYIPGCRPEYGATLWLPALYEEYLEKITAQDGGAGTRYPGDPIRLLIVDASETIRGNAITEELLTDDEEKTGWILDRAETVLSGLFNGENVSRVELTCYPELADVVIEIRTTYPFAGQYKYSSGTIANVWNTRVTVTAYDKNSGRTAEASFIHEAGQTVSTSGGTKIYMKVPDLTGEKYAADAQAFVQEILSWYPDAAK